MNIKSRGNNNIYRGLIAALNRKDEVIQNYAHAISHNLRSPVASIVGLAHLWETYRDDPQFSKTIIEKVLECAHELDQITTDLNTELSKPSGNTSQLGREV